MPVLVGYMYVHVSQMIVVYSQWFHTHYKEPGKVYAKLLLDTSSNNPSSHRQGSRLLFNKYF